MTAAAIRPGELVLDLGAGQGALTAPLIEAGARVIAVELHPRRAELLRRRFPQVTVLRADMTGLSADVPGLRLPGRPFRVVASPPYGASARLLGLLLAPGSRLAAADLVLQRAVVRMYASSAGPAARPAVRRAGRRYELSAGLAVPRRAFRPVPRVDSAVLVVRRR